MTLDATVVTIAVFTVGQLLSLFWTVAAIRGDNKVLVTRVDRMQIELEKLGSVMTTLAEQSGRITLLDERLLVQAKRVDEGLLVHGKRIDELINRMSRHMDVSVP